MVTYAYAAQFSPARQQEGAQPRRDGPVVQTLLKNQKHSWCKRPEAPPHPLLTQAEKVREEQKRARRQTLLSELDPANDLLFAVFELD
jgi:hypothetical protein